MGAGRQRPCEKIHLSAAEDLHSLPFTTISMTAEDSFSDATTFPRAAALSSFLGPNHKEPSLSQVLLGPKKTPHLEIVISSTHFW